MHAYLLDHGNDKCHIDEYRVQTIIFINNLSRVKIGGFPGSSDSKESACNAGDPDSIPGSGRSLGERNGNPLQCSCLENSMDRGAWQATVPGVAKSWTRLSD